MTGQCECGSELKRVVAYDGYTNVNNPSPHGEGLCLFMSLPKNLHRFYRVALVLVLKLVDLDGNCSLDYVRHMSPKHDMNHSMG